MRLIYVYAKTLVFVPFIFGALDSTQNRGIFNSVYIVHLYDEWKKAGGRQRDANRSGKRSRIQLQ